GKYKIQIAQGHYDNVDSFKKNIIASFSNDSNKIIGEVPSFGKEYTWRTVFANIDSTKTKGQLHHFSTMIIPEVDTSVTRLRITKSAEKYKDAYVFIDATKVLYDMNGMPVWFLPNIDGLESESIGTRDLKLSPQGTITLLLGARIYEINYNGDVLWKGPDNEKSDEYNNTQYHHEFTRLANGHYMVIGTEKILYKLPSLNDSNFLIVPYDKIKQDNDKEYKYADFGTLIEYDEKGKVVWTWKSSEYFKKSDLVAECLTKGLKIKLHENSFFFDEQSNTIYFSLNAKSRIIKVKYPEGNVLNTYGKIYKPGIKEEDIGLFCGQHSCRRSEEGYLYLYNNNTCNPGNFPTVEIFQESVGGKDSLKKVWEYVCTIADTSTQKQLMNSFSSGGKVSQLPDRSMFVCMGDGAQIFIVSKDKKILWSAFCEKRNPENKWQITGSYRADIISPKELERLIWHDAIIEENSTFPDY
ncbi:MAG: aryl-sulfate sulfotransferase, partial [Sphingobacteriales bacterium]